MIKTTYMKLMREQRELKVLEKAYNDQKKAVETLREEMIQEMNVAGTESYKSDLGSISKSTTTVPVVNDWEKFYDYIHKNDAFELLQRRASTQAWRDRVEDGEEIPGVSSFSKETLRITLKG